MVKAIKTFAKKTFGNLKDELLAHARVIHLFDHAVEFFRLTQKCTASLLAAGKGAFTFKLEFE